MFIFKTFMLLALAVIATFVFGGTYLFQRLTTYGELKSQNDSLVKYSQQVDSLKANVIKINRHLEFFKAVSLFDAEGEKSAPTIDEFLKSAEIVSTSNSSVLNMQQEFSKTPKIRPVTGIISRSFNLQESHTAIDFVAAQGSPVRATADGQVIRASFDEYLGNVVAIKHIDGYETLYAHCQQILVRVGQNVVQGETIALVGNSGKSSKGIHLHYEVTKDGKPINPETLFL
jgi:murein DD-endopeptidase MepM/ murein hydrolase activator NlpD